MVRFDVTQGVVGILTILLSLYQQSISRGFDTATQVLNGTFSTVLSRARPL
jgi:hypothetical protein